MPLESGSQILNYKGDAALGYGSGGTVATGSPIGIIDPGSPNQNGFDDLARLQFVKNKELYDAKKKETDDMYKAAQNLDLDTSGLLDIDRDYIINNDIKQLTDYVTAHPHAQTPKTPDQIKENIEFKRLYDNYKNHKSQAQVRAALAPQIQGHIANNTFDRDEEKAWYDPQLNKPLQYITPYGKTYQLDLSTLKGPEEEVVVGKEGPVLHTETKIKTNAYPTYTNTLAKLGDQQDKNFQAATIQQGNAYAQVYARNEQLKQQAIADANNIVDPIEKKKALDAANNIKPYLSDEINFYNNVATQNNKAHPDKLMPIYDINKPLNPQQLMVVHSISKNVSTPLESYEEKTSGRFKPELDFQKALLRSQDRQKALEAKGQKAGDQDYLIQALTPFVPPNDLRSAYDQGVKEGKVYKKGEKEDGIFYDGKTYYDNPIVIAPDGTNVAKINGYYIQYNGKEWVKVDPQKISVDDKVVKNLLPQGAVLTSTELKDGKLQLNYDVIRGGQTVSDKMYVDRVTYMKNIADSKGGYNATKALLDKYNAGNLNDDGNFNKMLEMVTYGTINGVPVDENDDRFYTYKGKKYTIQQIHQQAKASGRTDQEYIEELKIK